MERATGIVMLALAISLPLARVASGATQPTPPAPAKVVIYAEQGANCLTWPPVKTARGPVAGYNIYRATSATGPFVKVNPELVREERYTDPALDAEQHFYKITAVDFSMVEGPPSAPVTDDKVTIGVEVKARTPAVLGSRNRKIRLSVPAQKKEVTVRINSVPTPRGIEPISDVFDITVKGPTGANTTLSAPAAITIKVDKDLCDASRIQYYDGAAWRYVTGGNYIIDFSANTISYDRITHFSWYTVTNPANTTPPTAPSSVTVDAAAQPPYLSNQVQPNVKIDWPRVTNTALSGYVVYRWVYEGTAPVADKSRADDVFLPGLTGTPNTPSFTDTTGIPGES